MQYQVNCCSGRGKWYLNAENLAILEQAVKKVLLLFDHLVLEKDFTTRNAELDDNKYGFVAPGTLNPQNHVYCYSWL